MIFEPVKALKGEISAPPSKSYMIRAVVAGVLSDEDLRIENFNFCSDTEAAVSAAEAFGAVIERKEENIVVKGGASFDISTNLNCRESALTLRMFSAVAALSEKEIVINGEGMLKFRPMSMMAHPLIDLGVDFSSKGGFVPLKIKGPLNGGAVIVPGEVSSQFLSGLLMVLPLVSKDSVLNVKNLKSIPYIDMTLNILQHFGIDIGNRGYREFTIKGGQNYRGNRYTVEGDWSGAAFMFVLGALKGEIKISGLKISSKQGDRVIVDILRKTGACVVLEKESFLVKRNNLKPFDFDATDHPDLFPPLVLLASGCKGKSVIKGVSRLKFKESNRGEVLKKEFGKLGVKIDITKADVMEIEGKGYIDGGKVSSHGDHRIAMALTAASVISQDGIEVDDISCIDKSYPGFLNDFFTLKVK